MLPYLQRSPESEQEWRIWSFHHMVSHLSILQAIAAQKGVQLTQYVLEPIDPDKIETFLNNNASSHTDMNGVLGLQSQDLLDVDLSEERQKRAWVWIHYLEHQAAEQKLGIST